MAGITLVCSLNEAGDNANLGKKINVSVGEIIYMGMPGIEDSTQSMNSPQAGFRRCWASGDVDNHTALFPLVGFSSSETQLTC